VPEERGMQRALMKSLGRSKWISTHLDSPRLTSAHLTSPHLTSPHLASYHRFSTPVPAPAYPTVDVGEYESIRIGS
jgi:hypothetical protein